MVGTAGTATMSWIQTRLRRKVMQMREIVLMTPSCRVDDSSGAIQLMQAAKRCVGQASWSRVQ